ARPRRAGLRGDRGGARPATGHRPLAAPPGAAGPEGEAGAVLPVSCHDARELFSARVDGALTDAERAGVDAHLAGCPACRRELARFEATVGLLRAVGPGRAPVGFVDRVLAAAEPESWLERLRRRLFSPVALRRPIHVTVVAMVALIAVYLYERTPEFQ